MPETYDAIVLGSGPNGLAAAITLAQAGKSVLLCEGAATLGGSARSMELTLPGYIHDVCSTVHAMAGVSPFFRSLRLEHHGLQMIRPAVAFAHPLGNGQAAIAEMSLDATAQRLDGDASAYRELYAPLLECGADLFGDLLGPPRWPKHPLLAAKFGMRGLRSACGLAEKWFAHEPARALFAGVAAHAIVPLEWKTTAAFGLVLTLAAHIDGWPVVRGGSQRLVEALASYFRSIGGTIRTGFTVNSLDELPPARAVLCDVTPRQLIRLAGSKMPGAYRRRLEKFKYGPGAFKMDWALSSPIPWKSPRCAAAGTVHVGGTIAEIAASESACWKGEHSPRPFVLFVQPSVCDPTRAPAGKHVGWAYCHVPNGSTVDMGEAIENQIERFAPGFRDCILARHAFRSDELERYNPNLVGGDVAGGAQNLGQLFTRPVARWDPYSTPMAGVYLCSASTPPGGGVHGMCGYFAAKSALRGALR
jgi:phytoene dehydrogenase-like protein